MRGLLDQDAGYWGGEGGKVDLSSKAQGFHSKEPVATRPQGSAEGF